MSSVPSIDNSTVINNISSLKYFQNIFISKNRTFIPNPAYAAPELFSSPEQWKLEYQASGENSRLNKLMDETGERDDFKNIFELVQTTDDPNIIWKIESNYKSDGSKEWDLFLFSVVFSMIASKLDTIGITKWKESHKESWSLPYEPI